MLRPVLRIGRAIGIGMAAGWLVMCLACAPAELRIAEVPNRCSLRLDGDDDFVDLGLVGRDHHLRLAGSPFTLSAWFRQESGGDQYQRLLDKSNGPLGQDGFALAADPGERRIHFYVHNGRQGGDFIGAGGMYRAGPWHHVVAVARSRGLEIWVDGRKDRHTSYESGGPALPADADARARIGTWNHDAGREFKGWLDELAVWNTDLPGAAIEAIHASEGRGDLEQDWGAYRFSRALVGWWRMESDPGSADSDLLPDLSGHGTMGRLMPNTAEGNAPRIDCAERPGGAPGP